MLLDPPRLSVFVTVKSAVGTKSSSIVAPLFAEFGSMKPLGGETVALSESVSVAFAATVAVIVYVILCGWQVHFVVDHSAAGGCDGQVHRAAGSGHRECVGPDVGRQEIIDRIAPLAACGPEFATVTV